MIRLRKQKRYCFVSFGIVIIYFLLFRTRTITERKNYNWQKYSACSIRNRTNIRSDSSNLPWYFSNGTMRPKVGQKDLKLWPEGNECDDRIINQLMFIPENYKGSSKKRILLWKPSPFLYLELGNKTLMEDKCPVDQCYVTTDRAEAETVDAILFFAEFELPSHKKPPNQVWIIFLLEGPYLASSIEYNNVINWTVTYRRDSDIPVPFTKWVYFDPNKKQNSVSKNYAQNKVKKVMWLVSNCYAKNNRREYADELNNYISVDIYGRCGNIKNCNGDCKDVIKYYKFYLAFENSNCFNYITEKLFENAFMHDSIPIVMGPVREEYEMVAPFHSFIHVDDFSSPESLALYLNLLDENDELYNEYFQWKGTGEFIGTRAFCRICALLYSDFKPKIYSDWKKWWSNDTCTKYETYKYNYLQHLIKSIF